MSNRKLIIILAVVGFVVVGAFGVAGSGDVVTEPVAAAPTPIIVYVTPEPTAEPTLAPTPVPTLDATLAWFDFNDHIVVVAADLGDLLQPLLDDPNDRKATRAALAANEDELAWLKAHEPAACYEDAYDAWTDSIALYVRAFHEWLDGEYYAGVRDMNAGNDKLEESTNLMDSVSCGLSSVIVRAKVAGDA